MDYIERVNSLKTPRPLTDGLTLDPSDSARVKHAIREVDQQGFAIVRDFLSEQELSDIRERMASIFELTGTRRAKDSRGSHRKGYYGVQTVHVHNLFAKTRAVDEIATNPLLLLIIEGVLGPLFQMSVATAMCPDPGVDPQGFHQDDGHYPLPRPRPPFIANTLVALDDFTEANGATRLVPGSHRWTEPVNQDTEFAVAEMPAGSLLVFDGALWHAGGGNSTVDKRRRSINLNFNLSWLRQQENQYVGIPRDMWLSLPEKLQRLLGFQKVNFLYGSVDYTDPLVYFKEHPDS
ncbi:MAG: phytanoyl-CoA dioxygenase family protein [Pseudomonadota bacterium]|nr:phytanoyl-CoA dioxygenase family protein [Pseudomonadota bacterium]